MAKKINGKEYDAWSKEELIKEIVKIKSTTYGLVWHRDLPEEKIDILVNPDARTPNEMFPNEMAGKPFPVLKEVKGKAIESDKSKLVNLLIEGDNYHSLAVLNFTHREAVDLIYIDPPYNTGNNDFIYNDKFVDKEDSFRHSKWLSFMEKRLKLAKNLLKSNGAIFISIDDNEQAPLKMLCDEIFGDKNFISKIIVQSNPRGSQASKHFAGVHEYVLVYAKSADNFVIKGLNKSEDNLSEYSSVDKQGKKYRLLGLRQRGGEWKREQRPKMFYPFFVNPKDCSVSLEKTKTHFIEALPKRPTGEDGRWTWSKEKVIKSISLLTGKKVNRKDAENFYDIFRMDFLEDDNGNEAMSKPKTIWIEKELNYQNGRTEIKDIFGKDIFDYPKPTFLIKKIIEIIGNPEAIILDFFAGSGTTAQAVLSLNKDDDGSRNFILCTNNENNICTEICYPRVKKVMGGYKNQKKEEIDGFGGNLKYYKTDFVEAEPTDKNKRKLVKESTDMLCILENAFELIQETNEFKIFKNTDKYIGVIFYEEAIEDYKKAIEKIDGHFNTYVFSMGDDPHTKKFADVKDKVTLCAIPEVILKVYREIFK
jgi:adenine-specific DNA-methyltransferase